MGVPGGEGRGRGDCPPAVGRSSGRAPSEVRGSSPGGPPADEEVVGAGRWGVVGQALGVRRGGGGRRTSLTSAQCEPLPVKPSGQGPQRAPLAVSVQATPGKQKPGEHWLSGRTVSLGVRAGCIPAGSGARVVKATPRGGAYRDRASHLGKILAVPRPRPVLSARLSRSLQSLISAAGRFFPLLLARLHLPASLARFLALWGVSPSHSLCLSFLFLSLHPSSHASVSLRLLLCLFCSRSVLCSLDLLLSPHLFSLPGHPVSAAPAALTARVTLHHRVFQERDLLDLWRKGGGVWSAGLRPSPPRQSPLSLSQTPSAWHRHSGPSPHRTPYPQIPALPAPSPPSRGCPTPLTDPYPLP